MRPLLEALVKCDLETSVKALSPEIATKLQLSKSDLAETVPSNRQSQLYNRLQWAKTYLVKAQAIQPTRRGYFQIADRGRSLLRDTVGPISNEVLQQFPEFRQWIEKSRAAGSQREAPADMREDTSIAGSEATPEEQIIGALETINADLRDELLARFRAASPAFFERAVIDLLQAMGFAQGKGARSFVTGKSGDGGIDGIVHQDALGLDAIYIQAKRYAEGNGVGSPAIQGFIGSMVRFSATKGVFVTTSHFSREAIDYVNYVPQRVVLIDGERLAELALKYNIGTRIKSTIELKTVDEAYFEDDIGVSIV